MTDIQINKFGKGIDLSKVKGGLKKEEMKTEEQKSIFKALDKDNNGILDEKELKQAVDVTGDNKLSKKEARAFIKENGLDGLKKKDIMKFVETYINNTQDVADVKTAKNANGETTVQVTYNDGTQETINADRSSELRTQGEDGSVTTQYKDANKNLVKDTVEQENGDTVETEYEKDGKTPKRQVSTEKETGNNTVVDYENGKPAKEVATDNTNNTVSTTNYENGTPKTKTVEQGETTVSNYTITEDGKEVLDSKIENKGIEAKEKRTDYTYNEDGTVTANVKEPGKDTVQQLKDGKVQSEVIKEKDKTTTRTFTEDGSRTEVVTDDKGNTSTTNFNADGNKLSQTKTVNGKEYSVEYDGKGNTKVVLQNGESVDALARKFNTTKKAVLEANGGKVRGWAGDSIVVPGEIEADSKKLQGRDSAEEAKAKYRAFAAEVQRKKDEAKAGLEARQGHERVWTEQKNNTFADVARDMFKNEGNDNPNKYELQMRIDELKKLNPNLKEGELIGKRITGTVTPEYDARLDQKSIAKERKEQIEKAKIEAKTGKELANAMYRGVDDHAGGVSSDEFKNALAKVNKDNVVGLLEQYNKLSPDETLIEAIMDETGNTMTTRRNAETKIVNALIERAKSSGVTDERAKQQLDDCINELKSYWSAGVGYCSTEKLDGLVKNIVGAIHTAEAMTKTEKRLAANDNAIDDTLGIMNESVTENTENLQRQLDQDGWCADLYEGLKWCVGSDNLDENVKADLKKFESSMKQLDEARQAGGEEAFKTKFKEIFGVTYDPNLAKGYRKLQTNLANAQALTVQLDGFNKEFANSINGKESYDAMLSKFGSYMQQTSEEVKDGKEVVEKSITLAMQKDGIEFANATDAQKAQYLRNIIKDTQSGISSKINEYTSGKDLATLEADLKHASTAVFGNKGDIVNRVNSYVNSQQVGGAVVNGAVKAIGAIAIAVCTGGTGLVALTTVAAGTAALSAATDLSDRASSEVGLQDGEITNILKNAAIDGVTVFAGGKLTKAAMAFKSSKAFVQAGGRMLTQAAGDVAIGAAAEYGQTGEITLQGVTFQAVFSAAGNLVALKQLAKGTTAPKTNVPDGPTPPAGGGADAPQAPKAPKQNTLDVATSDGNKAPGGPLGDAKMEKVKVEVSEELPSATPERGAQIHQEADQLQAQSRTQGRDVKHMVEDEFGVVTIGKEHIDISTADAATLERLQKEVSGWSTDTRNRAEILKKLEARKAELQTAPETPKTTRSSEFVEKINANAQQNASDILAGKQGALPPHDAATLKEHLVNNLNTTEEIEGFMDALKKRVGVNDKGDMHVYQVQGVDQAADVMKAAEAKLAKVRAKQADVAATNSAADAAINGSRGLNNEEFATIKSFVDRTDSAEDLQALLKKFQENKNLRNSSASKKLVKTMQEKIDLLNAKAAAQTPATPAATQGTKPTETYVNSHEIRLDRAPEAAVPEGATIDFAEAQRRMPKTSETPAAPAAPKAPEVEVDPHHITIDEAPAAAAPEGSTIDFFDAQRRMAQGPSAETPVVSKPAGSPAPVKPASNDVEILGVESAPVRSTSNDVEILDAEPTAFTGKFKNLSNQVDNATSLGQLEQLEQSVLRSADSPQKTSLLNKIKDKKAELRNQYIHQEPQNNNLNTSNYDNQLNDDINNMLAADMMMHDDAMNGLSDDGGLFF